jgi:hypothetical protein
MHLAFCFFCSFTVYLKTLSVSQAKHVYRMVGSLNDVLETTWKAAIVT